MRFDRVILAAHGAGDGSASNASTRDLAARLEALLDGPGVSAAFNLGAPGFAEAVRAGGTRATLVVPLMTSDGYFVRRRLLSAVWKARGAGTVAVAPPVGVEPGLLDATATRAARAARQRGGGGVVLVVGHGARRHAHSGTTTRALRDAIAGTLPEGWSAWDAYLDQAPLLEDLAPAIAGDLVVLPWLIGGGGHDLDDIGERTGVGPHPPRGRWLHEGRRRVLVLDALADAEGGEALLASARRVVEAASARFPLRLATRSSRLALWQAVTAVESLERAGVPGVIVPLESEGDRDLRTPIEAFGGRGVFTDDLTRALARGDADAAVHSLKDLPLGTESSAFDLPAVLARDTAEESLVSRGGLRLEDLPFGALVGTSSPRRAAQVRALRGDLRTAPIRGAVPARVRQVMEGAFDATILATAGLERLGLGGVISERFEAGALTPEPGQGVIALQAGRGDWFAQSLLARVDHADTRRAIDAERAFARTAARVDPEAHACALATPKGGGVSLRGRIVRRGEVFEVVSASGDEPSRVGRGLALRALSGARLEEGAPA